MQPLQLLARVEGDSILTLYGARIVSTHHHPFPDNIHLTASAMNYAFAIADRLIVEQDLIECSHFSSSTPKPTEPSPTTSPADPSPASTTSTPPSASPSTASPAPASSTSSPCRGGILIEFPNPLSDRAAYKIQSELRRLIHGINDDRTLTWDGAVVIVTGWNDPRLNAFGPVMLSGTTPPTAVPSSPSSPEPRPSKG